MSGQTFLRAVIGDDIAWLSAYALSLS